MLHSEPRHFFYPLIYERSLFASEISNGFFPKHFHVKIVISCWDCRPDIFPLEAVRTKYAALWMTRGFARFLLNYQKFRGLWYFFFWTKYAALWVAFIRFLLIFSKVSGKITTFFLDKFWQNRHDECLVSS